MTQILSTCTRSDKIFYFLDCMVRIMASGFTAVKRKTFKATPGVRRLELCKFEAKMPKTIVEKRYKKEQW